MRLTHDSRQWQSLRWRLPKPAARLKIPIRNPGRNARWKTPHPIPKNRRWERTAHTSRDEMNIEEIQPSGAKKPTGATGSRKQARGSPARKGRPATITETYTQCTAKPKCKSRDTDARPQASSATPRGRSTRPPLRAARGRGGRVCLQGVP